MTWTSTFRLGEPTPARRRLEANEAERKALARELDLVALDSLVADLEVTAWLDGLEIAGRWRAAFVQTCGVTLERLDQMLSGAFKVRVVPPESPLAQDAGIDVDPEAEDPPDVMEGASVDLAAYVVEHFALEIDPFPRKPGAEFAPPETSRESSPFDVLRKLRQDD